jgi:hypothetical protein
MKFKKEKVSVNDNVIFPALVEPVRIEQVRLGYGAVGHPDEWVCEEDAKDAGTRGRVGRAAQTGSPEPEKMI